MPSRQSIESEHQSVRSKGNQAASYAGDLKMSRLLAAACAASLLAYLLASDAVEYWQTEVVRLVSKFLAAGPV